MARPSDIYAMGRNIYRKATVMDIVIASAWMKSWLSSTTKSSDFVLPKAKNKNFSKELKSSGPI